MKKRNSLIGSILKVAVFGASAGILHKANFIMIATEGSFIEAAIAMLIGGILMICGGISIMQLSKDDEYGNLIRVFDKNLGRPFGYGYAWFQYTICMPVVAAILAWVAGCFTINLFGYLTSEVNVFLPFIIGLGYAALIFALNYASHHLAHKAQRITTIIKYGLFIGLVVVALIYKSDIKPFSIIAETNNSVGWLGALGSVAFCLEGWYVLVPFTKHSKSKNPTLTLALAGCVVILFYIIYLWAMSHFSLEFMESGNNHLLLISRSCFGEGRIILIIGLLAMLGGLDTDIMGLFHMPQVLAKQGYGVFKVSDKEEKVPFKQIIVSFLLVTIWMGIHFVGEHFHLLHTVHERVESDFAESALIACYFFFILLYVKVIRRHEKGNGKVFSEIICPILAIGATLLITVGAIYDNPASFPIVIVIFMISFVVSAFAFIKGKTIGMHDKTNDADKYTDTFIE